MNIKQWAAALLVDPNMIILDTETTGLDSQSEAVSIGILSPAGIVLLDTLVKPLFLIPANATRIHGLTDDHVKDSPTILDLEPRLKKLIYGKKVAVYNADYDWRILWQSFENYFPSGPADMTHGTWLLDKPFVDVMQPYAEFWGEWNDYHQSYRWQRLTNACRQQGIVIKNAHHAIGDCMMTLALLRKMAE